MKLRKLLDGFGKRSNELDGTLADLAKEAEALKAKAQQRYELEEKIEGLEAQIAAKEHEIHSLKANWSEAVFNEDESAQEELQEKRRNLKAEIEALEQEMDGTLDALQSTVIDSIEIAELAAKVDTTKVPDFLSFIKELERILRDKSIKQRQAIKDIKNSIPTSYMSSDDYDDARAEIDSTWPDAATKKARRERLAAERAARPSYASSAEWDAATNPGRVLR